MKQKPRLLPFPLILLAILLLVWLSSAALYAEGDEVLTKCQIAYQKCIVSMSFLLPNVTFESFCTAGYIWCIVFLE